MSARRVTLTFDNGPDAAVTPGILDCLAHHGILSTFFVLGRNASTPAGSALARRTHEAGHWIGNHTYSHRVPLGLLPASEALDELNSTALAVAAAGETRLLFRPFGGQGSIGKHLLQPAVVDWLTERGYTCVLWNCVPADWRDTDHWPTRAFKAMDNLEWSVVVLHDIYAGTLKHLDRFLGELKSEGYEIRQDFPASCTPIVDGRVVSPLEKLMA